MAEEYSFLPHFLHRISGYIQEDQKCRYIIICIVFICNLMSAITGMVGFKPCAKPIHTASSNLPLDASLSTQLLYFLLLHDLFETKYKSNIILSIHHGQSLKTFTVLVTLLTALQLYRNETFQLRIHSFIFIPAVLLRRIVYFL